MQVVSPSYREQMDRGIRNVSYAEIKYSILNADATEQAVLSDNGHVAFSNLNIKNTEDESAQSYLSFEPGRWALNQKMILLPEDESYYNTGFVSDEISDENGIFANPPTITVNFTDPQSFYGYTLTFDEVTGDYPAEVSVNGVSYFPTGPEYVLSAELVDVTSVSIAFLRSSKPYRRARLTKMIFGQVVKFANDQIIKVGYQSNIDFLSTQLSQKKLSFTIDNSNEKYNPLNPKGILQFAEERQPVSVRFGYELDDGSIEWVTAEQMTLQGAPSTKGMQATFTAGDSLNILTGTFYKGLYRPEGITLHDLAVEVLTDAGVESYELDPRLSDITTKGALPVATHSECLQIIANAGQCILYTDRNGAIKMESALDPTITPYDSGHMFFSDAESTFYNAELPQTKYLDFLPNSWDVGNDKLILLPSDSDDYQHVGFVSEAICDENGVFAEPPVYGMRYSFPYPSYTIPIVFDSVAGEYATDFSVVYYKEGAEIDRYEITGNDSVEYLVEHSASKADDIQICVNKWSVGNRRAVINRIGKGRINNYMLRLSDVTEQPSVNKQALCKSVTVNCYGYTASTSKKELYREQVGIAGKETTLAINHDAATQITASFTGGTIVSQEHYTYQSVITVSGAGELVLNGQELVTTTTSVIRYINAKGEDKKPLENPLITSMDVAADAVEWVADYFAKRNILNVSYRGSPELDVYDTIYMASQFNPMFPVRIMELSLDFNGGLSGKAKAVMI